MIIPSTSGDDNLLGTADADQIDGGYGDDVIDGKGGDDTLTGGPGNDTLTGGDGNDIFVFAYGFDEDTITDFHAGDRLDVSGLNIGGLDTLQSFIQQSGDDTKISFYVGDNAETITLTGVTATSLTASSFIFNTATTNLTFSGTTGNDVLFGGNANDTISGSYGDDLLLGGKGNDRLVGEHGNDTLTGGDGDDVFVFAYGFDEDTITDFHGGDRLDVSGLNIGGLDTLQSFIQQSGDDTVISFYVGDNPETITLTGVTATSLTASSFIFNTATTNLTFSGTTGNDVLFGGNANDTISGSYGDDLLLGGKGNDRLVGEHGNDTLTGGDGNDVFVFAYGFDEDTITDFHGGDRLDVSGLNIGGLDTLQSFIQQSGDDTVISFYVGDNPETITLTGVTATSLTASSFIFNTATTNLTFSGTTGNDVLFGGNANDTISGSYGDDLVLGGKGNDRLVGEHGNDTLTGGDGNDIFVFAYGFDEDTITDFHAGDRLDMSGLNIGGLDTLQSFIQQSGDDTVISFYVGDNPETITLTGVTATSLTASSFIFNTATTNLTFSGTTGNDVLFGGNANDTISGSYGDDLLLGGAGNDTLTGGGGTDIFVFSQGSGQDTITDFAADEIIDVSSASGFGGYTSLTQVGKDTLVSFSATDSVLLKNVLATSLTSANFNFANIPGPIVGTPNSETLDGTTGDDVINGLGGNDTLNGLDGNDVLDGGTGADKMVGGAGNDTYYVDNTGDVVTELAGGGIDTVITARAYTLGVNVEKLTLTGTTNIGGTGNSLANVLIGNDGANHLSGLVGNDTLSGGLGNDVLDGGKGADAMKGGAGDDRYYVENVGDVVTEYSGQGHDTVVTTGNYALGANVEDLILVGTHDYYASGNALDNHITGNLANNLLHGGDGNDIIDGGKGADKMYGGLGDDTFYVDNIGDVIVEYTNQGNDTVFSTITSSLGGALENLILSGALGINGTGNSGDNILTGNGGANILTGGKGHDTLTGGLGADTFVLGLASGADIITDFSASQNDKIDLSAYHAQSTAVILQIGPDTTIDLGGGNIITLTGVTATDSAFLSHITW